jgi:hypothetical protein
MVLRSKATRYCQETEFNMGNQDPRLLSHKVHPGLKDMIALKVGEKEIDLINIKLSLMHVHAGFLEVVWDD